MKNIEISTSQNVTIEYELASVNDRVFAFLIDVILLAIVIAVWNTFIVGILFGANSLDDGFLFLFFTKFMSLLICFFYFLLFESFTGQTLGKKALNTKIIRLDGQEPTMSDYALRSVFHLLDTLTSFGVLATVLVISTSHRQRLGDMAVNTAVIKLNPSTIFRLSDILNIDSLESYQPVYPQVTQLKESDMLLVKSTIARYRKFANQAHSEAIIELTRKLVDVLGITSYPKDSISFLMTILKDYIVLTR